MMRFFIFCSGADPSILAQCPTERTKHAGIGATIVFTAVLAGLSGGYALFTVFHSVAAALPFALLWALMIFNLDRVIISSMRKQTRFLLDLLYACPRLLLAALLAVVISKPLELKLFASEIAAQMTRTRNQQYVKAVRAVDQAFTEIDTLKARRQGLADEIRSKQQEADQLNREVIEEVEGRSWSKRNGVGPIAREKQQRLGVAQGQLADLEPANRGRIAQIDQQLQGLEADRRRRLEQEAKDQAAATGFLARLAALSSLADSDPAVRLASWFVTLLLIVLEILPVAVKLLATLSPYRPYEQLLEDREWQFMEGSKVFRSTTRTRLEQAMRQEKAEIDGLVATEMAVSSERNRQRLEAELSANEALMRRIAAAQTEIAERIVEKWKAEELDKVDDDPANYISVA